MKKQLTKEYYISDFSPGDAIADGKVYPTKKDATRQELNSFAREIRWCELFGGDMSGKFIPLDPSYTDAVVTFVVKIDKPGMKPEYIEKEYKRVETVEAIKDVV